MKLFSIFRFALIALVLCAAPAFAQKGMVAPASQFGLGFGTYGGSVQYALSPSFHIGSTIGLNLGDVATGQIGTIISPYGRLILEGMPNPFVQANLTLAFPKDGDMIKSLQVAFGTEYFATKNVGVLGMVSLMSLSLETGGGKAFGILGGEVGVEWFFN